MTQFGFLPSQAGKKAAGRQIGEAMQVVVLASQKGGSGKTTLAGHLAVQAVRAGNGPIAIVDTDPQGSLIGWGRVREDDQPTVYKSTGEELANTLVRLRDEGFRLVFVDTPPAVTSLIADVVTLADLVVIPTRPSPHDLRAVGATVDIVESRGRQMIFVINSATARAKITSDAAVALSQHGTVAPIMIHNRVDYAASMIDGRTVMEKSEKGRSAKEIETLWEYLADRLAKIVMEQARMAPAPAPAPAPVAAAPTDVEPTPIPATASISDPATAAPLEVAPEPAAAAAPEVLPEQAEPVRAAFPAHGPSDVHRRFAPTFGRRTQPAGR